DRKIEEILVKIEVEKKCLRAAELMRPKLKDKNAIAQCETSIRESQKRLEFLEGEQQKLSMKKSRSVTAPPAGVGGHWPQEESADPSRIEYSQLDLRKTESPLTTAKISLKMHEIAFKLDIEKKLREGTSKMHQLYQMDQSDKKNRTDAINELAESNEKIRLLNAALRRYQGLFIGDRDDDEEEGAESKEESANQGGRRPLNGRLLVRVDGARHLAHAPTRGGRGNETIAVLKIDGSAQARTRASRSQRWLEEFELRADKAAEFEVTLYDRVDGQQVPVGLVWVKLSELLDDLRRAAINTGADQVPGWAPAAEDGGVDAPHRAQIGHISADGIECWWDVEPIGQISMRLNFIRDAGRKRIPSRLGRQGAVRKRRGEVYEMNGHKFSQKPFYNIMKCAFCSEFLLNAHGVQCEDCKYTCHKKCYPMVVTKCISRAYEDMDPEEDKLSHRIPHRFDNVTSLAPNWCCHCGYMLPLGKKHAKKCTECGITCHASCAHLVPDFCGMSMEMANRMLREMEAVRRRQRDRPTQGQVAPRMTSAQTRDMHPSAPYPAPAQSPHQVESPNHPSHFAAPLSPRLQEAQGGYGAPLPGKMMPSPHFAGQHGAPPCVRIGCHSHVQAKKVTLDDFNLLAVLGKGNFGKVMLAEEKNGKNLYAIKMLKKEFIIQNDEVESTKSEKRVFMAANRERHPFLVGLHSCFQTDNRIYFVMEYVSGGDLMLHIQRQQFSERRAKFYACEVLLALEYFHRNDIVYRDLKLDNILLTLDGHIKIADYGLCKESMGFGATTNTFCGTPEFMAPEILLDQRYSRAVDWWAFGVLIYEMLLGQSPFHGDDEEEIFESILEDEVLYPINMSRDSVSILQRLLTRDPTRRLGAGPEDALEIKRHPFFRSVDWDAMLQKKVPPPFFPEVKSRTDVSNFDEEFTRERPVLTPTQSVLDPTEQAEFTGFSYVASWVGGSQQ
ncbi:kinase-like domain-containing protein, partial [Thamnocephalis sphaerospora]